MSSEARSPALAEARHGSWCPKMCTFACPVTTATGRDDAVPWSFHGTLVDLAEGRLEPGRAAAGRLAACSGCLACQVPCEFDQDIPDQVRAGRGLIADGGHPVAGAAAAAEAVAEGRSPFEVPAPPETEARGARAVVLVGCRDGASVVRDAVRLLAAGGMEADVAVPDGCCGATLADLGLRQAADEAAGALGQRLEGYEHVLVLDPHCLPVVVGQEADTEHLVVALARLLADGRLAFQRRDDTVTYHDPCLLARRDGVTEEPRRLLAATGARIVEPEHAGAATACSGAGLALELVDHGAAAATAGRRRGQLGATGVRSLTGCAGAAGLLSDARLTVSHLVTYLAAHLEEPT